HAARAVASSEDRSRSGGGAEQRGRHRKIAPGPGAQGAAGRGAASGLGVSLLALSREQRALSDHRSLAPYVPVASGGCGRDQAREARDGASSLSTSSDGVRSAARHAALGALASRPLSVARPHTGTAEAANPGNRPLSPGRASRATSGPRDRRGPALDRSLHAGVPDPAHGPGADLEGHGAPDLSARVPATLGIARLSRSATAPPRSAGRGD